MFLPIFIYNDPLIRMFFIYSRHGLGDTYNKIFCDPKLPFADCARKWCSSRRSTPKNDSQKASSDEEEPSGERERDREREETGASEGRMSLRRSRRTMGAPERDDDDTDALSELETLAKLGRVEEPLGVDAWFSERALETRLHHIAHAVQNREWPAPAASAHPAPSSAADDRKPAKRHIAIDVETDRAKLHALLSSPAAAHSGTPTPAAAGGEEGPPPAHQRVPASPAGAAPALDLSAPLDLSEAHDFSVGRRTPHAPPPATHHHTDGDPPRSKLDDTLSKLMKRKNVVS